MNITFNTDWWKNDHKYNPKYKNYPNENLIRFSHIVLGSVQGKEILDIGCGTGAELLAMAQMGASCTGIEIENGVLKTAAQRFSQHGFSANFLLGNNAIYDIRQKFDFIYSLETLQYLGTRTSLRNIIEQCYALLNNQGRLLISIPTKRHFFVAHSDHISEGKYIFNSTYPSREGVSYYIIDREEDAKELMSSFVDITIGYYEWCIEHSRLNSYWLISGKKENLNG